MLVALLGLATALALGALAVRFGLPGLADKLSPGRYSHSAYLQWLDEDAGRARDFRELGEYLERNGVADAVPVWQLTRTDSTGRMSCERPAFMVPPRESWSHIVPVLQLVRDEIEPLVGPVEVASSYRTAQFNDCVGGASQSRHLGFAALDLIAANQPSNRELFERLCAFHRKEGARYAMGLGAYFDPEREGQNRYGRFHVDVSGYRSWGYSQHGDSSSCRLMRAA